MSCARAPALARDPVLGRLIRAVGPCTLRPNPDGFQTLVRSVVSQMISTKAALAISGRLESALAPAGLTPAGILAASEETLRGAGLSGAKARALHDLAGRAPSTADFPSTTCPACRTRRASRY